MFLPINKNELIVEELDFVLISSDAYVDHPTYGHAIISRLIEHEGFSIGIIPQPLSDKDYYALPIPKIAYLVSGGVVDSMVNNYTVAKKRRAEDVYSPKSKEGKRPDRQVTVYVKTLKRLFPSVPVVIGGIEASLRRFAHYDYWSDSVMKSILLDSGADLLIYGMGENPFFDILDRLKRGIPLLKIKDVRGTSVKYSILDEEKLIAKGYKKIPSFEEVSTDKVKYAEAFREQSRNTDALNAEVLYQICGEDIVLQNLPAYPLTEKQMDEIYAYPYMRASHPIYDVEGGIRSFSEVKFSVTSHRGCFGSCSFCALNYHQGRRVQKRSDNSIVEEATLLTTFPDFKGYIHDLSGPSANLREPSCDKQLKSGVCKDRYCLGFKPCPNLKCDESGFIELLRKVRAIPKVKKVFVRSGVRFDYLLYDKNSDLLTELCKYHISGQLKVAPEHISNEVLKVMNKPSFEVYKRFSERYKAVNKSIGKEQYLVPYLISSHPGCTVKDAVELTEYLKSIRYMPEQVQDFYPTPSTRATCMYYTGIDPDTLKEIYVPKSKEEKKMQRALLQYRKSENAYYVQLAYKIAGKNNGEKDVKRDKKGKKNIKTSKKSAIRIAKNKKYGKIEKK